MRTLYVTRTVYHGLRMRVHRFSLNSLLLLLLSLTTGSAATAGEPSAFKVSHAARFQFVADYRFTQAKQAGRELETLAQQLWAELMIPDKRTPVRIYLFTTQDAFSSYVRQHIPSLRQADTNRTAMFLLRNDTPYIFAVAGTDLILNLRHEFVHVLLNTAHDDLPIWLDEGLAEYYETQDGEQQEFRKLLLRQNRLLWRPSLSRLERLKTMSQLGVKEYAEGWSWVHLLMRGSKEQREIIPRYLADLRKGDATESITVRIESTGINPAKSWTTHHRTPPKRVSTNPVRLKSRN